MLIPPGYISARDTCRAEGLLGPVGLPSCHSAGNGTSGYSQYFTGIHTISLSLSSVLATLWGAAHQPHDRWEVTLTEMKHQMIPGKPSPQIMKAPCADSRCCRGKCRWDYYWQAELMAALAFAVPAGNLFSWLLESWKVPRDIRKMMHALTLSHHHLLWGGCLLKAASSCGTAPAGSIWRLTGWHLMAFGGHCFCWAVSWLSKELGDCRQRGSQISAVSLLLSWLRCSTSSGYICSYKQWSIASKQQFRGPCSTSNSHRKWISVSQRIFFNIKLNTHSVYIYSRHPCKYICRWSSLDSSRSKGMHSPENNFWSLATLTTEILRYLEAKPVWVIFG